VYLSKDPVSNEYRVLKVIKWSTVMARGSS